MDHFSHLNKNKESLEDIVRAKDLLIEEMQTQIE